MTDLILPNMGLVLLIGASSSGKSTFAKTHFLPTEIISSDQCRALVSDDENNQEATGDAFLLLNQLVSLRLKRKRFTVIDATSIKPNDRAGLIELAKQHNSPVSAIVFNVPLHELLARHQVRLDRSFGNNVIERHFKTLNQGLRNLESEGFANIHYIEPNQEYQIVRETNKNNSHPDTGLFDIIGDVHGCLPELLELLENLGYKVNEVNGKFTVIPPQGRILVFVGDLVDRGPNSPEVLQLVMDMVADGNALCVCGNHDDKFKRYLKGNKVSITHGLDTTIDQFKAINKPEFNDRVLKFLEDLPAYVVLDNRKLVVAHAGIKETMIGRSGGYVREFCLYGETTGQTDELGLPIRINWAKDYKGKTQVVYGHTPVAEPESLNNSINIDTGCVFGGKLTALRYPEQELISVQAQREYANSLRPFLANKNEDGQLERKEHKTLDNRAGSFGLVEKILGKHGIETGLGLKVTIPESDSAVALENFSRFAVNP